ncbi:MAG: RNA methyltransferase [Saprospiraceae bacterium]|nr:RNA methyltransferase [Saprospiraceae bacterium]MCF8248461.1 RNA methyltransferase [Saprospiraceae bacterium]MCF8281793.1 RNA methyltransferase [Bacteroidales bacterium]MCF8310195.1 RNA methyltransferase [Saprospiraceae bacterium]MCF8439366.1 RNA methyltransferase [Saprospiraceae bacterium]
MRKLKMDELDRASPDEFREQTKMPITLVLDDIRSALNVGAAFRTADAFALEKIYLCGITATPPHREILKTALGATETVIWEFAENAADAVLALKKAGYDVCAIEQVETSTGLQDFAPTPNKKIAVVFGNEVNGVNETTLSVCDCFLEIPQFGTKHSLNVAVCIGIVVWDIVKKLKFSQEQK